MKVIHEVASAACTVQDIFPHEIYCAMCTSVLQVELSDMLVKSRRESDQRGDTWTENYLAFQCPVCLHVQDYTPSDKNRNRIFQAIRIREVLQQRRKS